MTGSTMPESVRFNVTLSSYEFMKLICWAKIHGRNRATYAAQLISSKIDENLDLIDRQMAELAKLEGITVEELEQRWLQEENFSGD